MKYPLVAIGLAAAITLGVSNASAAWSRASTFELVFNGTHEPVPASNAFPYGWRHTGTFTATAPFCSSGTAVDLAVDLLNGADDVRRYTCADGSGSLTLVHEMFEEHKSPWVNAWRILAGTGRYADLRGRGSYEGEFLSGDPEITLTVVFRSTFRGLVDFDSVAPAINVSKAKITKLTRPAWTYVIHLTLSIRDRNTAFYVVKAVPQGEDIPVAAKSGKTTSGKVGLTLRPHLSRGVRVLVFQLSATDEVGNVGWSSRSVKLPR